MTEKQTSLEIIAPTVEEAISRGLEELGLPEEQVEVEVLDAGSKGLFGLGSRQARVRLKISMDTAISAAQPPSVERAAPVLEETSTIEEEVEEEMEEPVAVEAETPVADENALQVAQDVVRELLQKMKVRAQVSAHQGETDDETGRAPLWVDIRGNDLSILIGPRAETLNALQYVSSLIVSAELGRSVSMVVDVEGYRARRAQSLRHLARRMADQAVKTGKRQVLEPMPASERRLIHIELRSNPNVSTESVGEEPRRKVTIIPKGK